MVAILEMILWINFQGYDFFEPTNISAFEALPVL